MLALLSHASPYAGKQLDYTKFFIFIIHFHRNYFVIANQANDTQEFLVWICFCLCLAQTQVLALTSYFQNHLAAQIEC